ncbi:hypothetical protein C8J57DRAFT_1246319 [Mycena rebaudengoi]|nr:hypothetical protein C8J57DRAFT_1246319 [Mycena rebaudengoi]
MEKKELQRQERASIRAFFSRRVCNAGNIGLYRAGKHGKTAGIHGPPEIAKKDWEPAAKYDRVVQTQSLPAHRRSDPASRLDLIARQAHKCYPAERRRKQPHNLAAARGAGRRKRTTLNECLVQLHPPRDPSPPLNVRCSYVRSPSNAISRRGPTCRLCRSLLPSCDTNKPSLSGDSSSSPFAVPPDAYAISIQHARLKTLESARAGRRAQANYVEPSGASSSSSATSLAATAALHSPPHSNPAIAERSIFRRSLRNYPRRRRRYGSKSFRFAIQMPLALGSS